jgi:hypothetical protein
MLGCLDILSVGGHGAVEKTGQRRGEHSQTLERKRDAGDVGGALTGASAMMHARYFSAFPFNSITWGCFWRFGHSRLSLLGIAAPPPNRNYIKIED